ncbi:Stage II sporulation protein E (SpoIIE) [Nocardioides sp. YR527]|uniref:SpoIIE family protein phosphatase n=1 Tax=Nocardioides sp. YR527 TaxID=1881028 RepID=UPI0008847467|nr:SpoIIE family protein phosphatase [Nocardioides sp. YR527]SDK73745.1 Stage II sporulation protein E (SpoIIE) [Nocardioides sp. YR527]
MKNERVRGRHPDRARTGPAYTEPVTVAAFAAGYLLAVLLGRATVQPESTISMVWPAAGVSVLWIAARARRQGVVLDVALIGVLTAVGVAATGGTATGAAATAVGAVVQVTVTGAILAHRCPRVWRSRGRRSLERTELWPFFLAAFVGPLMSAPVVGAGSLIAGDGWRWDVILLWCARNMGSIVVLCPLGFSISELVARRTDPVGPGPRTRASAPSRPGEQLLVLVISPALHALWFLGMNDIALVFPLLALACWAGVRLPAPLVSLHGGLVAVACIGITALGRGPFLGIGDPIVEIAVSQLYVVLVCVIGLALALDRDARDVLSDALADARDQAQAQADLFGTIINTMSEGVRVVDREGAVMVRNPAATRLLLGAHHALATDVDDTPTGISDVAGIRGLDGAALAPTDLPFRRSLAGSDVRDLDLLVRPATALDAADERIVAFTTARLPESAGGGVVTVLRDVTAERQELHRAAQVQMSLLPAEAPRIPGYELAARFVPAGSVGGDFYDWHGVDDGLVLTLADVMGKGPGAAILAATTRSLLRAHADAGDVVTPLVATEQGMVRDLENTHAFVTMFRAFLHLPTGVLTYSDAGHGLAAVVAPDGAVRRLQAGDLPLGVAADVRRTSDIERLEPGEILVVVSDGVLDALGGTVEDLSGVWRECAGSTSAAEAVAAALRLTSGGDIEDDLTILALRRRT